MKPAFLFGPFIGSLSWELFRFAPYAIYLKHNYKDHDVLVYTRPERFDLYGSYADILIPLRIKNDSSDIQYNYSLKGLEQDNYNQMIKIFERKYRSHYKIVNHFYPDINGHKNLIKWQFPRNKMNYNFNTRPDNTKVMSNIIKKFDHILIDTTGLYLDESFYFIKKLDRVIDKDTRFIIYNPDKSYSNVMFTSRKIINLNDIEYNISVSKIGCLIEVIKKSLFTISTRVSEAAHLSLLLGTELKLCGNTSDEFIDKINPRNTSVYFLDNYDFKEREKFEL